jgi:TatD DNase family protein
MITVATSLEDIQAAIPILHRHENVFLTAGIHPHEAGKCDDDDLAALERVHREETDDMPAGRLVAVGETGLDFHYDFAPPERQEQVFRAQIEIARRVGQNLAAGPSAGRPAVRPIVIHARESEQAVCDVLSDYPDLAGRVVFHCFSADVAVARRILDMGLWLSFTGVVTFRNAAAIREAACYVPADRIMVETDAPYLSPEPVRKIRPNEPAFVKHTAEFLADLRGESYDRFAEQTTANAERFFGVTDRVNE